MMPTGPKIMDLIAQGVLVVDPLPTKENINPNSVNLCLGPKLKVYKAQLAYLKELRDWRLGEIYEDALTTTQGQNPYAENTILDPYRVNPTIDVEIPPEGLVLSPYLLYLGHTIESAGSRRDYAPVIEGRSTWARVALQSHFTAGFGDAGFARQWTLEIGVMSPVRVRRGDAICQIAYHKLEGPEQLYDGRYANQVGATAAVPLPGKV